MAGPDGGPGTYADLPRGVDENLEVWAPWVRGSLYLVDMLRGFDWTTAPAVPFVLSLNAAPLLTLHRPDKDLFRKQLRFLRAYADQRSDRAPEILTQTGFPTEYFTSIMGLNGDANRHTFELIFTTQVLTSHIHMIAKHDLACRRPDKRGSAVMPMIPTPAHGTFPSGHAAEAFAVATVLCGLVDVVSKGTKAHYPTPARVRALLFKQAERIAVNRTVAGVHFPIDTWAGAALGEAIGQVILAKCLATAATPSGVVARTYEAMGQ